MYVLAARPYLEHFLSGCLILSSGVLSIPHHFHPTLLLTSVRTYRACVCMCVWVCVGVCVCVCGWVDMGCCGCGWVCVSVLKTVWSIE